MMAFAHSQATNKLANEAANDSTQVSRQDRKILPGLKGTNQMAEFRGYSTCWQAWKKIIAVVTLQTFT